MVYRLALVIDVIAFFTFLAGFFMAMEVGFSGSRPSFFAGFMFFLIVCAVCGLIKGISYILVGPANPIIEPEPQYRPIRDITPGIIIDHKKIPKPLESTLPFRFARWIRKTLFRRH